MTRKWAFLTMGLLLGGGGHAHADVSVTKSDPSSPAGPSKTQQELCQARLRVALRRAILVDARFSKASVRGDNTLVEIRHEGPKGLYLLARCQYILRYFYPPEEPRRLDTWQLEWIPEAANWVAVRPGPPQLEFALGGVTQKQADALWPIFRDALDRCL
jgi:hypothetical protein